MITTYQQFSDNTQRGSGPARTCAHRAYMRLARDLDGFTALAISSAMRGEDAETAAAHCECTIADLDRVIAAFTRRLLAGRKKAAA